MRWDLRHGGYGLAREVHELRVVYPIKLFRPRSLPSIATDPARDDVYLRRLSDSNLHHGIVQAMRIALQCFRLELFVPALAMVGAAAEGAWIDCGNELVKVFPGNSRAEKLRDLIASRRGGLMDRVAAIRNLYTINEAEEVRSHAAITVARLHEIDQWTDLVRQARNVLHWGTTTEQPNDYTKTAMLLAPAVGCLDDLHTIALTARALAPL